MLNLDWLAVRGQSEWQFLTGFNLINHVMYFHVFMSIDNHYPFRLHTCNALELFLTFASN